MTRARVVALFRDSTDSTDPTAASVSSGHAGGADDETDVEATPNTAADVPASEISMPEIWLGDDGTAWNREGLRSLLSALDLKVVAGPVRPGRGAAGAPPSRTVPTSGEASTATPAGTVFDLAVFRATGDRRLAALFGSAFGTAA